MQDYILIADDDEDDRAMIAEAFKNSGTVPKLVFAENGEQVFSLLQNEPSLPKFILLDLNMPKKSGLEVLEELKNTQRFSQVPVIVYSTSTDQATITNCYRLGANCFISKPSDYQEIEALAKSITVFWLRAVRLPRK